MRYEIVWISAAKNKDSPNNRYFFKNVQGVSEGTNKCLYQIVAVD